MYQNITRFHRNLTNGKRGQAWPGESVRPVWRIAVLAEETPPMIEIFQVALYPRRFFKKRRWKFCFIGGIALQRWGEPRVTQDLNVSLLKEAPQILEKLEMLRRSGR
jgi:hypothetical protein